MSNNSLAILIWAATIIMAAFNGFLLILMCKQMDYEKDRIMDAMRSYYDAFIKYWLKR